MGYSIVKWNNLEVYIWSFDTKYQLKERPKNVADKSKFSTNLT